MANLADIMARLSNGEHVVKVPVKLAPSTEKMPVKPVPVKPAPSTEFDVEFDDALLGSLDLDGIEAAHRGQRLSVAPAARGDARGNSRGNVAAMAQRGSAKPGRIEEAGEDEFGSDDDALWAALDLDAGSAGFDGIAKQAAADIAAFAAEAGALGAKCSAKLTNCRASCGRLGADPNASGAQLSAAQAAMAGCYSDCGQSYNDCAVKEESQ